MRHVSRNLAKLTIDSRLLFLAVSRHQNCQYSTQQEPLSRKLALVMGVANHRSIAWACVNAFLRKNYDCIITYYTPSLEDSSKYAYKIEKLVASIPRDGNSVILGSFSCNVETNLPALFRDQLPNVIGKRKIDAVVHSVAYAPEMDKPLLQTSSSAFLKAQHVSAYSFLQTVRECLAHDALSSSGAVTTLTYVGAVRAVPGYGSMGPAKAALESIVRGLAVELGQSKNGIRINAVSAGPIRTVAARGIPNFGSIVHHVESTAPLGRNVSVEEVAETVAWISTDATGITGQTIYVDAGHSVIVPVSL